jgi:signal transduction histidine kinase
LPLPIGPHVSDCERFGPCCTIVCRLSHGAGAGTATLLIEDQGPDLPHVFEPFYRVDDARERQGGGAGLGLAITCQVVTAHGGSVSAANRPEGGLALRITLPLL